MRLYAPPHPMVNQFSLRKLYFPFIAKSQSYQTAVTIDASAVPTPLDRCDKKLIYNDSLIITDFTT